MNIKKGDMVSIKQDFIDRNNRYEYDSRDIWEVKEVYKIGGGYHVAVINNLTGYGNAHLCTYNNTKQPTLLPAIPSSSQGGIPGGTRRSVGSLLRGSRSGIERRSSGRRR